jgi:BON domain
MRRMFLAAVVASLLPAVSFAQSSSLFNRGTTGSGGQSSGSGGQSSGSGGTGSSGLFNNGNTGSQSSTGGSADSAAGATGTGSNSTGNTVGQGTTSALGTASGQQIMSADSIGTGPFTGRTENSRFIGVRATTTSPQQSGLNAFSQIFQGLSRGQSGNRNGGQSQPERLPLRPTLRVGFDYSPTTAATTISSPQFATRFSGIAERRPQLAKVNVTSDDGGRVVLRGTVASEDSKNLAAALLRLEPGVREVVNELTVENAAAE